MERIFRVHTVKLAGPGLTCLNEEPLFRRADGRLLHNVTAIVKMCIREHYNIFSYDFHR